MDSSMTLNITSYGIIPWFCWILALGRVFWEFIGFNGLNFPLSRKLASLWGEECLRRFHRTGFWICVGYLILHAPELLRL